MSDGQSGVSLVIGLMLLLAVTLLGVSAMSTVVVEEKMADNMEKLGRAFQAAESGVVQAMRDLSLFDTSHPSSGTTGPIGSTDLSADFAIQYQGRTAPDRAQ
jgi:type IV pilus assembly protein PilX